jgi:putative OPT family oligopeptide transporter
MTICALLLTSAVMLALGIKGDTAIVATLGVAGVVCCAACTSGDIAQDLKTGVLVGATPARQQTVEFIGVLIPAFIFAPILGLLHNQYGIGDQLRAPQAALFASLTEGFFGDGDLPLDMVGVGAGIGVAILIADFLLVRRGSPIRLYIMPIAVGLYLPLALAVPILLGGMLRATVGGRGSAARDTGVLFGSGLIAGEALMGIGIAAIAAIPALSDTLPLFGDSATDTLSIAAILALVVVYARFARR